MSVLIVGLSHGDRNVLSYTRRMMKNVLAFRVPFEGDKNSLPLMAFEIRTQECKFLSNILNFARESRADGETRAAAQQQVRSFSRTS